MSRTVINEHKLCTHHRVTFILPTVTLVSHLTADTLAASTHFSSLSIKSVLHMFAKNISFGQVTILLFILSLTCELLVYHDYLHNSSLLKICTPLFTMSNGFCRQKIETPVTCINCNLLFNEQQKINNKNISQIIITIIIFHSLYYYYSCTFLPKVQCMLFEINFSVVNFETWCNT